MSKRDQPECLHPSEVPQHKRQRHSQNLSLYSRHHGTSQNADRGLFEGPYDTSNGIVKFTESGISFREIRLDLPFPTQSTSAPELSSGCRPSELHPLNIHNWDNPISCQILDNKQQQSKEDVIATLQMTSIKDRAVARFVDFIGYSRIIPKDYDGLPLEEKWVHPTPFTASEMKKSANQPAMSVVKESIIGTYYPEKFHGIRQAFQLNPTSYYGYVLCRGTKVLLGNVIGMDINYYATRIRFASIRSIGIEVVAFTSDGSIHGETSLSWPPIIIELPLVNVDLASFPS